MITVADTQKQHQPRMKDDPKKHHRRSIRLKGFDYAQEGMYFVTICVNHRKCLFGEVDANEIRLSQMGRTAKECWEIIPKHFCNAELDQYVIMPNHIHGIVFLKEVLVGTRHAVSPQEAMDQQRGMSPQEAMDQLRGMSPQDTKERTKVSFEQFGKPVSGSLSTIMRSFKSAVSREAHRTGYRTFAWQSRFYDHVIRDGKDLDRIRRYILDNPINWENDYNYPENIRQDRKHEGEEDWSALD